MPRSRDFDTPIARAVAIINPISGAGLDAARAAARVELVRQIIGPRVGHVDVHLTEGPGHAAALARDAAESGADVVVAWGGDGTVNEAAGSLVGAGTAFGLVPAGSGNGLAASLGTPRDAEAALARILTAPPRAIDVGRIAGRYFFNVAGIGFDAHIAARFNARGRGRRGGWPYIAIGLREGCMYRSRDYTIALDGESRRLRALLIAFANGREYGMGMQISPGARLDDGLLESTIIEDRPIPLRFWHTRYLAYGRMPEAPRVYVKPVRQASIASDGTMQFHADGETATAASPLDVAVLPGALLVRG